MIVDPQAVWIQAVPYIAIVGLVALLILPSGWRGIDPVDGWILLAAYVVYLAQALLRGRGESEQVQWKKKEVWLAIAGVAAIAGGTYLTVMATEKIVTSFGISKLVGGLFITAPVAALPEIFATWYVARSGQITSAVTSVIGDHAVTLTLAILPLAIVTVPASSLGVLYANMAFVALMPIAYAIFIHKGSAHGFSRGQVLLMLALLGGWIATVSVLIMRQ